jgi:hypothetical protein
MEPGRCRSRVALLDVCCAFEFVGVGLQPLLGLLRIVLLECALRHLSGGQSLRPGAFVPVLCKKIVFEANTPQYFLCSSGFAGFTGRCWASTPCRRAGVGFGTTTAAAAATGSTTTQAAPTPSPAVAHAVAPAKQPRASTNHTGLHAVHYQQQLRQWSRRRRAVRRRAVRRRRV